MNISEIRIIHEIHPISRKRSDFHVLPQMPRRYREGYTHCRDCDEELVESLWNDTVDMEKHQMYTVSSHDQLTELITGMSNDDLLQAVEKEYDNYTREALDIAQQELRRRNLYFIDKSELFPQASLHSGEKLVYRLVCGWVGRNNLIYLVKNN